MKQIKRIILLFMFGVLIILTCTLIMFTVRETDYVIVTRFGKPVRIIDHSGLQFKWPGFLETINRIDRRINVFVTQPIQLMLGDKNPIILTCYVCWRVNDPALFFQSVAATESAQQKLGDMINSQLGIVLGDYRLNQIINTDPEQGKLGEIESRILKNANENVKSKYGFEILQLGVRRLNYPSIVAKAVFNRMQSEREKEAKRYRAEGTERAAGIEAETDREVTEILSKAYQESETIKGDGDREAIRIYAEAYGQDPELFNFLKSIELYETLLQGKSTLVISTQNDLFKYLTSPNGDQR